MSLSVFHVVADEHSARRVVRRTGAVLGRTIAMAGLMAGSGCELMPDPEFSAASRALALVIVEASRSRSVGSVDFEFQLKNQGESTVRACLGPSRSVSDGTTVSSESVNHPRCIREFALSSGGAIRWRETIKVTGLRAGRAEVQVEIEVVNPRRCGKAGCTSVQVTSQNKREVH
jgi:hypothetical protein